MRVAPHVEALVDSDNNGTYGFRVDDDSPPIATTADLMNAGNTATGNATADFRVD